MRKMKTGIGLLLMALVSISITSCKDNAGLSENNDFESDKNGRIQLYAEERSNDEIVPGNKKEAKSGYVDFTETAKKVLDAVVHIRSTQLSPGESPGSQPRELPEFFRDFFGDRFHTPEKMPQQPMFGSGSGVIIDGKQGYIVTNNHVINNAKELQVTLHNNESYKAAVIGTDPTTDIALLQIKGENLKQLSFVDSDDVEIGEWVLAVGNPFSLYSTVTAGIISAKARNININPEKFAIESFIQTDAAINPGNSGGALVDLDGRIVGINTAIASSTGSYSG